MWGVIAPTQVVKVDHHRQQVSRPDDDDGSNNAQLLKAIRAGEKGLPFPRRAFFYSSPGRLFALYRGQRQVCYFWVVGNVVDPAAEQLAQCNELISRGRRLTIE